MATSFNAQIMAFCPIPVATWRTSSTSQTRSSLDLAATYFPNVYLPFPKPPPSSEYPAMSLLPIIQLALVIAFRPWERIFRAILCTNVLFDWVHESVSIRRSINPTNRWRRPAPRICKSTRSNKHNPTTPRKDRLRVISAAMSRTWWTLQTRRWKIRADSASGKSRRWSECQSHECRIGFEGNIPFPVSYRSQWYAESCCWGALL